MDIGHNPRSMTSHKKGRKAKQNDDNSLKVVYISTPMKVRTNVARFRFLVQELTGKNSDIARYMDVGKEASEFRDDNELLANKASEDQTVPSTRFDDTTMTTATATATASGPFLGNMENVFTPQMVEKFGGIMSNDGFCDPYEFDMLGSYDDLV